MAAAQTSGNSVLYDGSRTVYRERPDRWDHPMDPDMLGRDLSWVVATPPFDRLNPDFFATVGSLEQILQHDSRISRYEPGDLILREGNYGSSAFLVLRGSVRAFLVSLWDDSSLQGTPKESWWGKVRKAFGRNFPGESIAPAEQTGSDKRSHSRENVRPAVVRAISPPSESFVVRDGVNRVFLQDIEGVLNDYQSESLGAGTLFGEMAAITRTPHRFSVVADTPTVVLEIRWQGLRLLRRDPGFRNFLDERYRTSGLHRHLRETPLFRFVDDDSIAAIVAETKLESFGDMEWFADYKDLAGRDLNDRIDREPLIAKENKPASDLYLIRAGFARVSFERGNGHQTLAYLGRGQMFGLEELSHRFQNPTLTPLPYQTSLRALGFVDVLRIPAERFLASVLSRVRKSELPASILKPRYDHRGRVVPELHHLQSDRHVDSSLMEFLVDERIMNGQKTMTIDLSCCTGCDECVKACAATHQGIPRFLRSGPQFGRFQFPHACMHCVDPVCMIGCPTGAIHRNPSTGVVSIKEDICIGCKTCAESCPYNNIEMLERKEKDGRTILDQANGLPILKASKCDLCQSLPTGPACQQACPHQALFRLDTSDVRSLARLSTERPS
ncbi:MAG: cyclic nucleotide-binding domain-containing protein [Pirellula sp.]|nr:cyclic nucleotide-binding domain-containing protein [Pirellula sp.]